MPVPTAKTHKNCQSCGMPMKRDESGGGTEADGKKSRSYCSHCYQDGKFTYPDLTMEQMRVRVQGKLKEHGMPGFVARLLTSNIPKLERWKREKV